MDILKNNSLKNDLFLRAAAGHSIERPPVWLMRQAGRILPEYRALRAKFPNFKVFVETPEAAAEATVQPVDALGVDAAIIFSDILVIPDCMGLPYEMEEKKGPFFPKRIDNASDVAQLISGSEAAASLEYMYQSLTIAKKALDNRIPLIGFAGAPWTLFAYMVEGSGSKTFSRARAMLYAQPELSHALLQKITDTVIAYTQEQTRRGVDLIQIFDSWAGELTLEQYQLFSLPYLKQIAEALPQVPKTIFAKGAFFALNDLAQLPYQVIGLDWNITPEFGRQQVGAEKILQGNLDPCCLYGTPQGIQAAAVDMLRRFKNKHIANLGHGVYPDTPLENVKLFVESVLQFRY